MAKKKKIMVKASLREISAVDKPAQAPALVDIRKSEDDQDIPSTENNIVKSDPADIIDIPTPAGETNNMTNNEELAKSEEIVKNDEIVEVVEIVATPESTEIENLTKKLERAEKAYGLSDSEKEIFVKMDTEGQDGFLGLSTEERSTEIQKDIDANPVVYTTLGGEEFKKSDDSRLVEMAKALDEANGEKAEALRLSKIAAIAKQAMAYNNLPGTNEEHVLLAEAVAKMAPEQQASLNGMLTKLDGDFAKSFSSAGSSAAPESTEAPSFEAQIEEIAKDLNGKHPNLTAAQSYAKALTTDAGLALYNQHLSSIHNK